MPIVAFVCAGVRSRFGVEWALAFLFVASCAFYVGWGVDYLIMMLASILVNWAASQSLIHLGDDRSSTRRAIFWAGIAFNFGALIWFKYSFFFLNYAESSAAFNAGLVAIPVGISFYTFQQAVFLLDAYRRDREVIDYLGAERGARGRARGFVRYARLSPSFPRHRKAGLARLQALGDVLCWQVRLRDRCADHGMIAVVIVRKRGQDWVIDTWLQSCRILQRGVEQEIANRLVEAAGAEGARRVLGEYIPTSKNALVADLFPRLGFAAIDAPPYGDGASEWFACEVDGFTEHATFFGSPDAARPA